MQSGLLQILKLRVVGCLQATCSCIHNMSCGHNARMQARLELIAAAGLVYTSLGSLLEAQHLREMYGWLERLAKSPMSAEDANLVPGQPQPAYNPMICLDMCDGPSCAG